MINNFLVEKNNTTPCMKAEINTEKSTALLEMSTVEENHRFLKVEALKILG